MNHKKPFQPLTDFIAVIAILNKIAIFAGLNDKQLDSVLRLLEKITYDKDELIFQQGESCSCIYVIESGKVKLYTEAENTCLELIEFNVGDCFGENSLIGIEPHTASALVVERTELIILSSTALLSLYERDKDAYIIIILNIAREISRRLSKTDSILTHYVLDSNGHH
jgi:CRP-like cAMP-binding protein